MSTAPDPPLPRHLDSAPELAALYLLDVALEVVQRALVSAHPALLDPDFDHQLHPPVPMLAANIVCSARKTRVAVARYCQDAKATIDLDRR